MRYGCADVRGFPFPSGCHGRCWSGDTSETKTDRRLLHDDSQVGRVVLLELVKVLAGPPHGEGLVARLERRALPDCRQAARGGRALRCQQGKARRGRQGQGLGTHAGRDALGQKLDGGVVEFAVRI